MRTIVAILITLLSVTSSFACMYDKDVPYEKFYEDDVVDSFFIIGSKTEGSVFSIDVKTLVKSNSTKQTCIKETFVVNCYRNTYHTEESTIFRNNIEISYNKTKPQRVIQDNIPAELFNLYCKKDY